MTSQVKKLLSRAFNDKNVRNEISESGLFDAEFYVANHSEAMKYREPLDYFIKVGLAAGHRPSANFDPALYFDMYPDVATSGQSALLHYIRSGRAEGRWLPDEHGRLASKIEASGLFDAEFYVALYPEVAKAKMTPLEHFVRFGEAEGRRPSLEFDAQGYLAVHRDVAAAKMSPLGHFVEHGRHEGRELSRVSITRDALAADKELIADSGLFDVDFYLAANPVARRLGADPILHYLVEGASAFVDPSGDFSTIAYLAKHPEVVQKGEVPLVHYLRHRTSASVLANDVANVRRSRPINSGLYFAREDLALTRRVAYSFFVRHGFTLETSGPTTHAADAVAALAARQPSLRIDTSQPDVSIIIPVYGQMPFVLACLTSLFRHRSQFSVEIIIADDTSPAEHRTELLQTIPWVRFHRNVKNLGFLDNCNEAAKLARGQYIVLLNSDTWVIDGWLDELIGSFRLSRRPDWWVPNSSTLTVRYRRRAGCTGPTAPRITTVVMGIRSIRVTSSLGRLIGYPAPRLRCRRISGLKWVVSTKRFVRRIAKILIWRFASVTQDMKSGISLCHALSISRGQRMAATRRQVSRRIRLPTSSGCSSAGKTGYPVVDPVAWTPMRKRIDQLKRQCS